MAADDFAAFRSRATTLGKFFVGYWRGLMSEMKILAFFRSRGANLSETWSQQYEFLRWYKPAIFDFKLVFYLKLSFQEVKNPYSSTFPCYQRIKELYYLGYGIEFWTIVIVLLYSRHVLSSSVMTKLYFFLRWIWLILSLSTCRLIYFDITKISF